MKVGDKVNLGMNRYTYGELDRPRFGVRTFTALPEVRFVSSAVGIVIEGPTQALHEGNYVFVVLVRYQLNLLLLGDVWMNITNEQLVD